MSQATIQETEQLAREARALSASKPGDVDVRAAVRDLTLHALKSRLLTAGHIATVTKAVGQGLGDSLAGPAGNLRDAAAEAAAGFGEAASKALLALELAAREFLERGGRLSPGETQQLLNEIAVLEQALGQDWRHAHVRVTPDLRERAMSLANHFTNALRDTSDTEAQRRAAVEHTVASAREGAEAAADAWRVIGLMASGALLGLSEALGEAAAPKNKPG